MRINGIVCVSAGVPLMGVRTHIWRHEIKGAKVSFFIVMINNPSPGWGAAIYMNKPTISRNCSQPPATIFWWFFVNRRKGVYCETISYAAGINFWRILCVGRVW